MIYHRGYIRADGQVFWGYQANSRQTRQQRERWLTPKHYELYLKNARQRRRAYKEQNRQKEANMLKRWKKDHPARCLKHVQAWHNRHRHEPLYRLRFALRSRISSFLNQQGLKKKQKTAELLGCSWDEARAHLEKQFKPGMTWENHGVYGWHIDHVLPLALAKNSTELKQRCHYTNLQPLWAHENWAKGGR